MALTSLTSLNSLTSTFVKVEILIIKITICDLKRVVTYYYMQR